MNIDPIMTHLRVNHFPIALTIVALGMAILAMAFRRRFLWKYAMTTALLAGIMVIPTFLTGDPAAHELRGTWYVTRQAVSAHDEAAEYSLWILCVSGLISLYALWRDARAPLPRPTDRDAPLPAWLKALIVVGILASAASTGYTGYLGGEIVHGSTQLRVSPTPPAGAPATVAPAPITP